MIKIIITITITSILALLPISCATTNTIASPPKQYLPNTPTTDKELIREWQQSLIKIKEWQHWYDIQINSNYFYTNQ